MGANSIPPSIADGRVRRLALFTLSLLTYLIAVNASRVYSPDFPGQLSDEDVLVVIEQDNRVGFFQQHILTVSWELPESKP